MSPTLFDLEPKYAVLADVQEAEDRDCDDDKLGAALEAIHDEARDKALSLSKVVKEIEAEIQVLEEQTRLLQRRAQARRDRVNFLRNVVRLELEASGLDRVRDPLVTVWLQQSPPSVQVLDEQAIRPELLRAVLRLPYSVLPPQLRGYMQHLDVDRAAILELARRTGEVPEGVSIRTGERHVRIR